MAANSKIEWTDASWTPIRARNRASGKIGWHCEQLGANPISDGYPLHLKDRKGGDPAEWPERLRIRQMPGG